MALVDWRVSDLTGDSCIRFLVAFLHCELATLEFTTLFILLIMCDWSNSRERHSVCNPSKRH